MQETKTVLFGSSQYMAGMTLGEMYLIDRHGNVEPTDRAGPGWRVYEIDRQNLRARFRAEGQPPRRGPEIQRPLGVPTRDDPLAQPEEQTMPTAWSTWATPSDPEPLTLARLEATYARLRAMAGIRC